MSTAILTVSTPWATSHEEDKRFRIILLQTLLLSVLLGAITPHVRLPQPETELEQMQIPRRVQLRAELPQPPVAPVSAPATDTVATNVNPLPAIEPHKTPEPRPSKTPRQKAASSGVLAMAAALKSLQDSAPMMLGSVNSNSANATYAAPQRGSTLSDKVTEGSGGIEGGVAHQSVLGETGLPEHAGASPGGGQSATGTARGQATSRPSVSGRSEEQIQEILDRNKGAMYTLYNRALRDKPGLQGKLVLSITIAPAGNVLRCIILSSELDSDRLEQQLVELVTNIDFGREAGTAVVTTKLPIDFFPR